MTSFVLGVPWGVHWACSSALHRRFLVVSKRLCFVIPIDPDAELSELQQGRLFRCDASLSPTRCLEFRKRGVVPRLTSLVSSFDSAPSFLFF